ncbi:MAG: enoyl-CoA hydratase/isomerase family protein [Propionibacteriales bacterium]|nr:enoyl-CoA hydratase/isomerase family protein [Propionibacteriales bacterium]
MSDAGLSVERADGIVTARLERPDVLNALNRDVLAALDQLIAGLTPDDRAVVLTGAGSRAFSAGADLDEIAGLDAVAAHDLLRSGQAAMSRVEASPVPVIAAVNGLALGGGFELALASTFMVLADAAKLGLPETGLGLIPGYGGTQRLARRVGVPVAAHTILTGERITPERAYALGLTPVPPVPVEELPATAHDLARRVASRGPRAVRAAMLALHRGVDGPLETGLMLESALAGLAVGGEESTEGVAAFRERRTPSFSRLDALDAGEPT